MRYALFETLLERVYGTFARNPPAAAQKALIFARCRDIPDEATGWIAERLCDEAMLPANMGRALQRGWLDWMTAHPDRVSTAQTCGRCDGGWLWCWRPCEASATQAEVARTANQAGMASQASQTKTRGSNPQAQGAEWAALAEPVQRFVQFMAPCPVCRAANPAVKPLARLEREGVAVMPADYPGGPLGFDRDQGFGVLWREEPVSGLPCLPSAFAPKASPGLPAAFVSPALSIPAALSAVQPSFARPPFAQAPSVQTSRQPGSHPLQQPSSPFCQGEQPRV